LKKGTHRNETFSYRRHTRNRALTGLEGVTAGKISRADAAHFILNEFDQKKYLSKTPLLTY
jgi:hypothetical protein